MLNVGLNRLKLIRLTVFQIEFPFPSNNARIIATNLCWSSNCALLSSGNHPNHHFALCKCQRVQRRLRRIEWFSIRSNECNRCWYNRISTNIRWTCCVDVGSGWSLSMNVLPSDTFCTYRSLWKCLQILHRHSIHHQRQAFVWQRLLVSCSQKNWPIFGDSSSNQWVGHCWRSIFPVHSIHFRRLHRWHSSKKNPARRSVSQVSGDDFSAEYSRIWIASRSFECCHTIRQFPLQHPTDCLRMILLPLWFDWWCANLWISSCSMYPGRSEMVSSAP